MIDFDFNLKCSADNFFDLNMRNRGLLMIYLCIELFVFIELRCYKISHRFKIQSAKFGGLCRISNFEATTYGSKKLFFEATTYEEKSCSTVN